jgi:hypothetical protein
MLYSYWVEGPSWSPEFVKGALDLMGPGHGKTYGADWVDLGYIAGGEAGIGALVSDIRALMPTDRYGANLDTLPMMWGYNSGADFPYVIGFTGSIGSEAMIVRQWNAQFGTPIGIIALPVAEPTVMPYIQAGQIKGFISGVRGCAEYEYLLEMPGPAIVPSNVLSLTGIVLIAFVVLGNILYAYSKLTEE